MAKNNKLQILTSQEKINKLIGRKLKNARIKRVVWVNVHKDDEVLDSYPKKKFCTQTELSKKLDCTFQQIQKYEKGSNTLSTLKLIKASNFLGVPLKEFTRIYEYVIRQDYANPLLSENIQLNNNPITKALN